MSKELKDYRLENSSETYWTNSAFSGMPTYQLGAKYDNNYIKKADLLIRFLPRPADYLFLYFLGFYVLMFSLKNRVQAGNSWSSFLWFINLFIDNNRRRAQC